MLKRMSRVNVSGHAIDGGFHCSATGQICVTTGVKPNKVAHNALQQFSVYRP